MLSILILGEKMKKMCQSRKKNQNWRTCINCFVSSDANAFLGPSSPDNSEQIKHQLRNPTEQLSRDITVPAHDWNPFLKEAAETPDWKEPLGPRAHEQNSPRKKPHRCTQCGKGFTSRKILNGHLAIHSGELPYECPECGKRFLRKSNLSRHLRVHTG